MSHYRDLAEQEKAAWHSMKRLFILLFKLDMKSTIPWREGDITAFVVYPRNKI